MKNLIETIERVNNNHLSGHTVIVWLTKEGQETLSTGSYEINSWNGCANIEWTSEIYGDQHIQIAPGGSEDQRILEYYLENPESAIDDIISKNEMLEEEEAERAA